MWISDSEIKHTKARLLSTSLRYKTIFSLGFELPSLMKLDDFLSKSNLLPYPLALSTP